VDRRGGQVPLERAEELELHEQQVRRREEAVAQRHEVRDLEGVRLIEGLHLLNLRREEDGRDGRQLKGHFVAGLPR